MSLLLYRLRELITRKHMTIAQLERILDFSGGSIARWDKSRPSVDKLQKVADYFEVSTDYLLGRTDEPYYKLTEKEKLDIGTQAEVNFYGEPMTDEARASLRAAIQMAMELNKEKAKQAFTPKKYRN